MSTPVVTQNWSSSRYLKRSLTPAISESWIVTGTTDKDVAIEAAVPFGAVHVDNPNMTAGERDASQIGPQAFRVSATFTFGDHGLCASTPLLENPQLIWNPETYTYPRDNDINNLPVLNSAGDPPSNPQPGFANEARLIVRKAVPYYSIGTALAFINHVNSTAFTIAGAGGVDVGQAILDDWQPTSFYTLAAPYVWVEYRFRFRGGVQPWQLYPVDAGRNGFYTVGSVTSKGVLVDGSGTPLPFDALLNGAGKPINYGSVDSNGQPTGSPGVYVLGLDGLLHAAMSNPSLPSGLVVDPTRSTSTLKTLQWTDRYSADFTALGL